MVFSRAFPRALTLLALIGICHFSLVQPNLAGAESIPPDKVKVHTPVYHVSQADFKPALGLYQYGVSWGGIVAARLWVKVARKGEHLVVSTVAKTNSFVDLFYKLRYSARGIISAVDLLPIKTIIDHRENSRVKKTELNFYPNGMIHSVHAKDDREPEEYFFDPNNFTLDPVSASFLARSQTWEKGQTREFDTFTGNRRYLVSLTADERIRMRVNGEERDVWVIIPRVTKLTENKPHEKLKSAKIYVTDDAKREILQLVSSVFVGSVTTELESFTPSRDDTFGPQIAKADDVQQFTFGKIQS